MWDYDKLFAEGNIVGLLHPDGEIVPVPCKFRETSNVKSLIQFYGNDNLSNGKYKIQYIIRLDEHGNVAERLFDREHDVSEPMPKLETGMFIRVKSMYGKTLGYVDMNQDKIIFQDGSWDRPSNIPYWKSIQLLEIYPSGLNCFDSCLPERKIWRSPEYQAYLNSKSN